MICYLLVFALYLGAVRTRRALSKLGQERGPTQSGLQALLARLAAHFSSRFFAARDL